MMGLFQELFKFRSLVVALTVRHLTARYRGSVLGFLWSFLNPLCLMLVYTLVFKFYIRNDVPNYSLFLFCGLLPWVWCTSALTEGTSSIVGSGSLITKSLFPPHILPAVTVLTSLIHFVLSLPLLLGFMIVANMSLHLTWLLVPVLVVIQALFLFGLTLILSSINVHFRDVQHLVGNILTFLFFLSPIVYPASIVPERFRFTLLLNPFALIVSSYHSLILEGTLPSLATTFILLGYTGVVVLLGALIFNRLRESFAELL